MPSAVRASQPRPVPARPRARAHSGPRRAASTRAPGWLPASVLACGPILGAVLGKAVGGYHGPVFAVLTVAAAAVATASASKNGRWWVIPALPPLAWLVTAIAELLWHDPPYPDAKAKAIGLVHATTHVFPVIIAALVAMALVCVIPVVAAKTREHRGAGGRRA
ncbi:MAG: hypothetical protein HOV87_06565 [Catenulispora sp.]|nr:hypothetical protein [Catenulispora sp.]